jgi:hypothetical protein
MDLWYPPDDEAPLLEWWLPLLLASAAARRERVPWPIHFDDFRLRGRIDRDGRPAVWVYHHKGSDQELYLDGSGQAYRYVRTPNARSHGRFTKIDIRRAVFAAGLPRHVEPVWYEEPPASRYVEPTLPLDGEELWSDGPSPGAARGHLTLIQGGRQAG